MNKTAVIFGNGGHAKVVHSIIMDKYENFLFVTEKNEEHFFESFDFLNTDCYIAIGDNPLRIKIYKKLIEKSAHLPNCIAPNAFIAKDVTIGVSCFIGYGVNILSGTTIGNNVIINTASSIDHDCIIGNHVQLTARVTLAGKVSVLENSFIGINSAIIPGITVADGCQIMAGSLVVKDTIQATVYGGYPAKVVKAF